MAFVLMHEIRQVCAMLQRRALRSVGILDDELSHLPAVSDVSSLERIVRHGFFSIEEKPRGEIGGDMWMVDLDRYQYQSFALNLC